jgi:hypothetical protein
MRQVHETIQLYIKKLVSYKDWKEAVATEIKK